jgi:hypothetical protein
MAAGPFPFLLDLALGQRLGFRARDDHEIDADRHEIRQFSKCFTRRSLYTIAHDRISDFARDHDSEARRCRRPQRRWAYQKNEMRRRRPKRAILDAQKLCTRPETRSHGALFALIFPSRQRRTAATSCRSTPRGACGPCGDDSRALCCHRAWTCGSGNRACARGEYCGADKCASFRDAQISTQGPPRQATLLASRSWLSGPIPARARFG